MSFKQKMTPEGIQVTPEQSDPGTILKGVEAFEESKRVFGLLYHENQRLNSEMSRITAKWSIFQAEIETAKNKVKELSMKLEAARNEKDAAIEQASKAELALANAEARISELTSEVERLQIAKLDSLMNA